MLRFCKLHYLFSIEPHIRMIKASGIQPAKVVFNPSVPTIYQDTFLKGQPVDIFTKKSFVSTNGALCAYSGKNTQRKAKNSRLVKDNFTQNIIDWNQNNLSIDEGTYELIEKLAIDYINHRPKFYLVDGYLGWDPNYRLKVRAYCTRTYHALFLRNMLVRPTKQELEQQFTRSTDITLFNGGQLNVSNRISGTEDEMITAINVSQQKISILGTQFAGQMKKALFKLSNYILPKKGVLPLRSSAFVTQKDQTCLLIGLPGSGKGSLPIHAKRKMIIANDEVGWSKDGIYNLEGGVYAKILNLKNKMDDEVQRAIKFGSVVQNANSMERKRDINFRDASITENARLCYPLQSVKMFKTPSISNHPKNVILLTCDLEGVLPPIAKLTKQQAIYFYLNGYTARLNNKEIEPKSEFSVCYSGDSTVLHPNAYADLFNERLQTAKSNVWLLNTGWINGRYGVGKRIQTKDCVRIIDSINKGELDTVQTYTFSFFDFQVPQKIEGLDSKLLHPEQNWPSKDQYQEQLKKLSQKFTQNFRSKFEGKHKIDLSKYASSY